MIRLILAVVAAVSFVASVHADALNLLRAGLAARVRGDFSTAIAYYTQAIDTGELTQAQLAVVLNGRGVAYDFIGDPDKAIADFTAAIQINANYGEAYINRGLAWVKKRDYDRGLADFTAATRDEKFAFLAFNNRANIYADNARSTRRAASLRERAMAANVPISSSAGCLFHGIGRLALRA